MNNDLRHTLLEVKDVTRSFGGFMALDGVSLEIGRGEVLGLVGPNGSGKTTLINVISGVHRPTSGSVTFEYHDVSKAPVHKRAKLGINRTFQIPKVFGSLTVSENLNVARSHAGRTRQEPPGLLAMVGLEGTERRQADTLNASQQKRLDLARALVSAPKLLLVDELGAGLNPAELDELAAMLAVLVGQGLSLLVVEHLMGFLGKLAERVVVLNAGKEIFQGTLPEATKDEQVVRVFLGG